jgi:predicted alpha-1,2-mannosidase
VPEWGLVLDLRMRRAWISALVAVVGCGGSSTKVDSGARPAIAEDLTRFVNPFIGTGGGGWFEGDTFAGAAFPLGMVQWSPDTLSNPAGGYDYADTVIKEFSLTHFSGRGCEVYQDIPMMPFVGKVTTSPATNGATYRSSFSHTNEVATPGYYKVFLDGPKVTAELTVTARTGFGRFTFPPSSEAALLVDAGGSINGTTASSITLSDDRRHLRGSATSVIGCGDQPYTIYFAAEIDKVPTDVGVFDGATLEVGTASASGTHVGAYLTFDTRTTNLVQVKVGVSYVSIANAQSNLDAESSSWDFDAIHAAAQSAWNVRLHAIEVAGGSDTEKTVFYTALYHTFFHPNLFSDSNGDYLGFDNQTHSALLGHAHYHNITGWDHSRTLAQLRAVLVPGETSDILQSLVDDAQQGDGHIPRWEQANADSHGMNGDGGSMFIAEAYALGARDFDALGALAAMDQGMPKIREHLSEYLALGYVPADVGAGNSAAVTLEYAAADFAIAQFAQALGDSEKFATYSRRAGNWSNLYNGATGYIQPRNSDGSWAQSAPDSEAGFQEGTQAQYTWAVPFGVRGLFDRMGGSTAAVARLDTFFTKLNEGVDSPYAFMGNEPCFEVPWEYSFGGAPAKTQSVVRGIQQQLFTNAPDGLPGNDDGGSTSAWYVFSALGLYPELPGAAGFVVGSPMFASATVSLASGAKLVIRAARAADDAPYVQGLVLNGATTTKLWIPWASLANGATLDFDLASTPSDWGSGAEDVPPSY